jgi:ferredoxin
VDRSLCIRCGNCAEACPVEAIYIDPEESFPYVCIHCGRCVPFCPHACLELADADEGRQEYGGGQGAGTGRDHGGQ